MLDPKIISDAVKAIEPEIIAIRRMFHEHPELGMAEDKTAAFCKEEAKKCGLVIEEITKHAFVAILDTGKEGKTIYMRADMDALPVKEDPLTAGGHKKEVVSKVDGVMHACGHDGHTAILIGAMRILSKHKDELCGKIIFLFESGEENFGSGKEIAAYIKEKGGDLIWGLHMMIDFPVGIVNADSGPRTSGSGTINATFKGRGGHSSRPDRSINPHVASAAALTALQSVVPMVANPANFATLAMCMWNGGQLSNVIPDDSSIAGGFRFYDEKDGIAIRDQVKKILKSIAAAHGCEVDLNCEIVLKPIINDVELSALARASAEKQGFKAVSTLPVPPSESFGYFTEIIPGVYANIGCRNEEKGITGNMHMECFDIDEGALAVGCALSLQFVCDCMKGGK